MARLHWLPTRRSAQSGTSNNRRRPTSAAALRRRPWFERLEERRLLAITVNTLVDELDGSIVDGDVSLRDAIAAAPVGETINFDPSLNGATILLALGELHIDRSLTIDATSLADGITIDATASDPTPTENTGDGSRVFLIDDGSAQANQTVHLRGLTLTGGDAAGDGGAILSREILSIERSTLRDNAATGNGGGIGADAASGHTVTIVASTISGNAAGNRGGGLYAHAAGGIVEIRDSAISGNTAASDGGGVYARTTAGGATTIRQSTISGNSANWRGGGVWAYTSGSMTTSVLHSTITLNTADADANNPVIENGGGMFASGAGKLTLEHTIVAGNVHPGGVAPDLRNAGGALSAKYNLIGTNAGSSLPPALAGAPDANGNIVGGVGSAAIDPGLAPLAANGGATMTHALLPASPAVNRGNASAAAGAGGVPAFDQRGAGFVRVLRGSGTTSRIDIGAYELADLPINPSVVDNLTDIDDGVVSAGQVSIREALRLGGSTITFDPALSGKTINVTQGVLLTGSVTIDASALPGGITIDGNRQSGGFRVMGFTSMANSTFKGLTIARAAGAGIHVDNAKINIIDCTIEDNGGSGVVVSGSTTSWGDVVAVNSTFRQNAQAGISSDSPSVRRRLLSITDCTISNNGSFGVWLSRTDFTMSQSVVSGNVGGIRSNYSVVIEKSTISNNTDVGIFTSSRVTLTDSTVSGNSTQGTGGGIRARRGTITNCTIADNFAAVSGGGIQFYDIDEFNSPSTITNSTISGNRTNGWGGGIEAAGPTIRFSTITGNIANNGGGGLANYGTRYARFENSIISGNTDNSGGEHDVWSQFADTRTDFSIVGRDNPALFNPPGGVFSFIGTNQNPVDPMLGPLADNGGLTFTHALLPGSIALDAGDPNVVAGSGYPEFDQRGPGFTRVANGRVDIGAFEVGLAVNTDPEITSPSAVAVPENTTAPITITAVDADLPPQTLVFSIAGGADAARFSITSGGALSFRTPPDFEAPQDANSDNVYLVTVKVDDLFGGADLQELSITVTAVNEHLPAFLTPAVVNVPENSTPVLPVTAQDADLPALGITYSIAGGADAARFVISPSGILAFAQPPNYEAPADANGDNLYVVIVQADDGAGGQSQQTINVTVTPVNDNSPVFTTPGSISIAEGATAVLLVTATDADLPAQPLSYAIVGGADASQFNLTGFGLLSFNSPPQFDAPTDANADNIYEIAVQVSDGLRSTQQTILVTVTAIGIYPLPGDFNDDGVVDAADLPVWKSHFGQASGANNTDGDADGDRDVDGNDFLIWQRTLGQVVQTVAVHAAAGAVGGEAQHADVQHAQLFTLGDDVILAAPNAPASVPSNLPPRRRPVHRPPPLAAAWTPHDAIDRVATLLGEARRDSAAPWTKIARGAQPQLADAAFSDDGLLSGLLFDAF